MFRFKTKAVFIEFGLESVFNRQTFFTELAGHKAQYAAASQTRESSARAEEMKKHIDSMELKNKQAGRLLIGRLSMAVIDTLRHCVPEEHHYSGAHVWEHLRATYDISPAAKRVTENPEMEVIAILRLGRPHGKPLIDHLRNVNARLQKVVSNAKFVGSAGARRSVTSLVLRHVLAQVCGDLRYQVAHDRFFLLVNGEDFVSEDAFALFMADVEVVDLAHASTRSVQAPVHVQKSGRGDPGRHRHQQAGPAESVQHSANKKSTQQHQPSHQREHKGGSANKQKSASVSVLHADGDVDVVARDGASLNHDGYLSSLVSQVCSPPTVAALNASTKIFLVDSGATHHCVREKSLLTSFRPGKHIIRVANGKTIAAIGKGDVILYVTAQGGQVLTLAMHEVFLVPSLANNIFSTNRFQKAHTANSVSLGAEKYLHIANTKISLLSEHDLMWLTGSTVKSKSVINPQTTPQTTQGPVVQPVTTMSMQLFHERVGHVHFKECSAMAAQQGIKLTNTTNAFCDVCQTSKQRKQPITDLAQRPMVKPGAILHVDIKGPLDIAHNQAQYALVVVDEATRMCTAKDMKSKDRVVDTLKLIIHEMTCLPGGKQIVVGEGSTIHSDSEAVLKSKSMLAYLASQGIAARAAPPHTHERNGIVERAIQTIFDSTRALMQQARLAEKYWPVAMQHAVYLRNRTPTQALGGRSPVEELTGSPPVLKNLRKFGCKAFVKVDDSTRSSLEPKSREGMYVGNNDTSNSFRVMVSGNTRLVFVDTIHCTFNESEIGLQSSAHLKAKPAAAAAAASTTKSAPNHTPHPPAPSTAKPAAAQKDNAGGARLLADKDPLLDDFGEDDDADGIVSALMFGDSSAPATYRAAMQSAESAEWAHCRPEGD